MSELELSILLFSGPFSVRGSCSYSLWLAEHLPNQGFRTRVVCPDARQVEAERRRELQIREYSYLQLPVWGNVVLRIMRRELQRDPPDLIHIQSRQAASQGMWLARQLKRPFILTVHDYLERSERFSLDRTWCRKIIAVSESVKADLEEKTGLPPELITVIQSGVETLSECRPFTVLETGRVPVIGTAGPLETVKGFPYFLGAAARVLAAGHDVEFIVAGGGPEESNLRRLARELKIDSRVTFAPNLLEFDDALAAMDIFCLPSLQQGIGTIMLQAMALGRPVIATRVGGVHRVIQENETGLLVPPASSEALASRILELIEDPHRARQIGAAGRHAVLREFSVERMVAQTIDVYREVLSPDDVKTAEFADQISS